MSHLKVKSEINRKAAELLLKPEFCYFPSSVHCSYYSCMQQMLHLIFYKLNIDKQEFYSQRIHNKEGSHEKAINIIEQYLIKKADKEPYKDFQRLIKELKSLRTKSDYYDEETNQEKGQRAFALAQSILNILVKNF